MISMFAGLIVNHDRAHNRLLVWTSVRVLGAGRVEQRSNGPTVGTGCRASAEGTTGTENVRSLRSGKGNRGQIINRETRRSEGN